MQWTEDVASGQWIGERTAGWGVVGGTVPRGYEAYARIFHPAQAFRVHPDDPMQSESRPVSWREVAQARGTIWHSSAQWGALSGTQHGDSELDDGWSVGAPAQGGLRLDLLGAVAECVGVHCPESRVQLGVWDGWGQLHPGTGSVFVAFYDSDTTPEHRGAADERMRAAHRQSVSPEVQSAVARGPLLELPGRSYVLLTADLREFDDPEWVYSSGLGWASWGERDWRNDHGPTPNLMWAHDRTWLMASEIDFDSTLIGGSRRLIDKILADERLEASEVTEDTDLSITGDHLNPLANS